MIDLKKVNCDALGRAFLETYLEDGFASLPKKEIDLLVLRLLLEHTDGWSRKSPPSAFAMAQALRTKSGRLRTALDELAFRDPPSDEEIREKLRNILKQGELDIENNKVHIRIEDSFLRECARDIVHRDYGITDQSFSRAIIVLSGPKFLVLVASVMTADERDKFEQELLIKTGVKSKTGLLEDFLKEFVKSAGKEAGKKVIQCGAAVLTAGLSAIPDLIDAIKGD